MSPQDFFYRDISKIEDCLEHAQAVALESIVGHTRSVPSASVQHAVSSPGIGDTQKATYVVREVNQIFEVSIIS